MNAIRRLAAASAVVLLIGFTTPPSLAQVVVFDPNNYAQNVLRAARALQQINNQITQAIKLTAAKVAKITDRLGRPWPVPIADDCVRHWGASTSAYDVPAFHDEDPR